MTGSNRYRWGDSSKPETVFPFSKKFGGKLYHQSLINPNFVKNCTKQNIEGRVKQLRREGWAARMVAFPTQRGVVYLAYERRTKRVPAGIT